VIREIATPTPHRRYAKQSPQSYQAIHKGKKIAIFARDFDTTSAMLSTICISALC
jgi:hypothetical protein